MRGIGPAAGPAHPVTPRRRSIHLEKVALIGPVAAVSPCGPELYAPVPLFARIQRRGPAVGNVLAAGAMRAGGHSGLTGIPDRAAEGVVGSYLHLVIIRGVRGICRCIDGRESRGDALHRLRIALPLAE